MIEFACPTCGETLTVPPEASMQTGPCPYCQTIISGPNASPTPTSSLVETPVIAPSHAPTPEVAHAGPAPSLSLPPQPAPPIQTHRLPLLFSFLITFLSSALFLAIGFYLGRTSSGVELQKLAQQKSLKPQTEEPQTKTPSPTVISANLLAPPPPEILSQENKLPDEATVSLEAFLSAPTWGARSAYSLFPEELSEKMSHFAANFGEDPIDYIDFSPLREDETTRIFKLRTPTQPDGFPVALFLREDRWLIDWEAFAEFHHTLFQRFTSETGTAEDTFRILLKPSPGEADPLSPTRCDLRPPCDGPTITALVTPSSFAGKQLSEFLIRLQQDNPDGYQTALANDGVPLILKLSRNSSTPPTFTIEHISAGGWIPIPPSSKTN